jgi:hypothetical protein
MLAYHRFPTAALALALCALGAVADDAKKMGRLLGAPVYDTEAETTYRQIDWNDFKGKVSDSNPWDATYFKAGIMTYVFLGEYQVEVKKAEGGGWEARPVLVRPYSAMDKFSSPLNQRATKRELPRLAHQQGHFDMAEMFARRLAVELTGFTAEGEFPFEAERDLRRRIEARYKESLEKVASTHTRYSQETNGGSAKKKQAEWRAKLDEWMAEATMALVELVERTPSLETP